MSAIVGGVFLLSIGNALFGVLEQLLRQLFVTLRKSSIFAALEQLGRTIAKKCVSGRNPRPDRPFRMSLSRIQKRSRHA